MLGDCDAPAQPSQHQHDHKARGQFCGRTCSRGNEHRPHGRYQLLADAHIVRGAASRARLALPPGDSAEDEAAARADADREAPERVDQTVASRVAHPDAHRPPSPRD
jgi:hypothetical protein